MIENDKSEFKRRQNIDDDDLIELERQKLEEEILQRELDERHKIELIEAEIAQRAEKERLERECAYQMQLKCLELEKLEQERAEQARLEQERLEFERHEMERIKRIECEREQKLRAEKAEIERIRAQRDEDARLEQVRRQLEQEKLEQQARQRKLQQLELERRKQEEKLKLEIKLSEICEHLNSLKEKIGTKQHTLVSLDAHGDELNRIKCQIDNLCENSRQFYQANDEKAQSKDDASDYLIVDLLDRTILAQFELIKSFVDNLIAQVSVKRNELARVETLRTKLSEFELNLDNYVQLANRYLVDTAGSQRLFIQNRQDLIQRIETIESIQNSVESCFRQMGELARTLNESERVAGKRTQIERDVLKSLELTNVNLKKCLFELDEVQYKTAGLQQFLKEFEAAISVISVQAPDQLAAEHEKYIRFKSTLQMRLDESREVFVLALGLFEKNKMVKFSDEVTGEFERVRARVNELTKIVDERCALVECGRKLYEKFQLLDVDAGKLMHDLAKLAELDEKQHSDKEKVERVRDMRKMLKSMSEEKEFLLNKMYGPGDHPHGEEFSGKLRSFVGDLFANMMAKFEASIASATERINHLEVSSYFPY